MNGMVRLIWTYLYRSREAASTVTARLDVLLKHFFPPNRTTIFPADDHLEPFIFIVHFILTRHFEYGRDLCLELLQESTINAAQSTNISNLLAPERMTIAIQAALLSFHVLEREEQAPLWPSSLDFSAVPSWEDYPSSSDFVPPSLLSKPGMQEFFDRCGSVLATIAVSCANTVAQMSIFDEQWSVTRFNPSYEETNNFVIRRHPEGSVAYPCHLVPQVIMLQTCFRAWPRCLHSSLPVGEAIDMLIRGIVHVEPVLGDVACSSLKRFMLDPHHAFMVLSRYTAFLFSPARLAHEGSGVQLVFEHSRLLGLWVDLVDDWISRIMRQARSSFDIDDMRAIIARGTEIEAGALFLLSHELRSIRCAGVKVMRLLGILSAYVCPDSTPTGLGAEQCLQVVDLLHGKMLSNAYLQGHDDVLDNSELARLQQWREIDQLDIPLRLADSDNDRDRRLWRFVYPAFLQAYMESASQVITSLREILVAAATRYHPLIAHVAGLSTRIPVGFPARTPTIGGADGSRLVRENKLLVDQWHTWLKILCSTATLSSTLR